MLGTVIEEQWDPSHRLRCPDLSALIISEFRLRGPGGAADAFIEIHHGGTSNVTVGVSELAATP